MEYPNFDALNKRVRNAQPKTVVVAAAHDLHTLEAICDAEKVLPIRCILVGNRKKICSIADGMDWKINAAHIIDADDQTECAQRAVSLIRDGRGDVLMKGILETSTLLKAVLDKEKGIRGSGVMSHIAVMESPGYHKLAVVTDGGMNPYPDLDQKAAIVKNAVQFLVSIGYTLPKVAALAASESVNEKMPETVDAAELVKMASDKRLGSCVIEGPLSFDIAVSRESAKTKGFESMISGETDIFLVPNISVGNILCKGMLCWGKAKMAGCVLGALAPIVLVSRGATPEEKLLSIILCASPT